MRKHGYFSIFHLVIHGLKRMRMTCDNAFSIGYMRNQLLHVHTHLLSAFDEIFFPNLVVRHELEPEDLIHHAEPVVASDEHNVITR